MTASGPETIIKSLRQSWIKSVNGFIFLVSAYIKALGVLSPKSGEAEEKLQIA